MRSSDKDLLLYLDVEKWQALQDSLAAVTGMAIITVDYKGTPITRHSSCSEFCKLVRNVSVLNAECQKCDSRGGLEATRLQRPYIYRCHSNILDAAIPIIANNDYLGAIMIGQVRLAEESEMEQLEVISSHNEKMLKKHLGDDMDLIDLLPSFSLDRVKTIVDMIFHLCSYIVEEAIEKKLALDMCAYVMNPSQLQSDLSAYHVRNLERIQRKLSNSITQAYIPQEVKEESGAPDSILMPAIRYINEHKSENLSLAQMAALCHISPSYFSKLFLRQVGETYSSYLLRVRTKWAKELLRGTDKSIGEIAADIGFSDASHFIRSFKKYEGVTPAKYRKFLS